MRWARVNALKRTWCIVALGVSAFSRIASAAVPQPDHVVIVILENHSYDQIIGNPLAPNLNALADEGALFVPDASDPTATRSGSHALRHPSQPNYLELFSGNNQGVLRDGYPGSTSEPAASPPPFNTRNLGAQLIANGFTFATYSESLPEVGSDVTAFTTDPSSAQYARKHNAAVNWQSDDAPANHHLAPELNQPFFPLANEPGTGFPADFSTLPTVSIVVPNEQHDMHSASVDEGDTWLKRNIIATYYAWAKTHNSLLIVTFDEDGFNTPSNLIPTIFAGPMIKPGKYPELDINALNPDTGPPSGSVTPTGTAMNHYNVLATVEDCYRLPHIGGAIGRPGVTDVFKNSFFANISTRMVTGTGDNVMIGGLIVGGSGGKKVLVRALGPSLTTRGKPLPGTIADPVIELRRGDGSLIARNDDWKARQQQAIEQTGLAPKNDRESAILAGLEPGNYTVIVRGKNEASGIALFEAYDVAELTAPKLRNVSTRGNVQTGDNVMIGGVIIHGIDDARVIFRGLGPSLKANGVPVANRLANPTLDLRNANGAALAFNDDWRDSQELEIKQSGLAPKNDNEAAIIGDYPPGNYTVILRGRNETTGIGLVEAYKLD